MHYATNDMGQTADGIVGGITRMLQQLTGCRDPHLEYRYDWLGKALCSYCA
ncbi:hypothetical protein [Paenibacillus sp. RC67]|uniref:hypothetical protein n=1 Tax=Paenibacillus sp. RC67 TaxID=3039392 RepID=UPI0024AE4A30|nr:hypothetical protein [Paenibacillus sp. RC67]